MSVIQEAAVDGFNPPLKVRGNRLEEPGPGEEGRQALLQSLGIELGQFQRPDMNYMAAGGCPHPESNGPCH